MNLSSGIGPARKPASVTGRNTAIDSLRVAMMCVVMFGHPLLPYTTVPRRFQDAQAHLAFDVLGVFLYGFAMPAFFVTAGYAAAGLYARRGARAFWMNRAKRIFLPLLLGYLLLTPLTRAAHDFAQAAASAQQWSAGWALVLEGRWLRWGKIYHLWFLLSLLVFSALALALVFIQAHLPERWQRLLRAGTDHLLTGRLFLLTGWIAVFMVPSYAFGTGQGTDIWMQLALFAFFGLGWLLGQRPACLVQFAGAWRQGGLLAVAVMPVCAWATLDRLHAEGQVDLLMGLLAGLANAALAVGMTLALIGLFQRYFSVRGVLGQYISDASYWIYLVHYPIVVAAGGLLATMAWPALAKYLAVLALSLPIILGSYEILVRRTALARWLGVSNKVPGGASPSARWPGG